MQIDHLANAVARRGSLFLDESNAIRVSSRALKGGADSSVAGRPARRRAWSMHPRFQSFADPQISSREHTRWPVCALIRARTQQSQIVATMRRNNCHTTGVDHQGRRGTRRGGSSGAREGMAVRRTKGTARPQLDSRMAPRARVPFQIQKGSSRRRRAGGRLPESRRNGNRGTRRIGECNHEIERLERRLVRRIADVHSPNFSDGQIPRRDRRR